MKRLRIVTAAVGITLTGCDNRSSSAPTTVDPSPPDQATVVERTPDDRAEPEPKPERGPASGHAVVRVGASLSTSSVGEAEFELPSLGRGPTAPHGVTVNVLGRKDGRLLVETLVANPPEHHCAGSLPGLRNFRLRLYVAQEDLVPVLTEEVFWRFEDGTSARIAKGMPVPTPIEVPVPPDAVGSFHEPGAPFSHEGGQRDRSSARGRPLYYDGDHPLDSHALYGGDMPTLFAVEERGSQTLVTVRSPCLEVVARAGLPESQVEAMARNFGPDAQARNAAILGAMSQDEGSGRVVGMLHGSNPDRWPQTEHRVEAGTAIVWTDGRPAGRVTAEHVFYDEPREQRGNTCFDVPLGHAATPSVPLCFSPRDVLQSRRNKSKGTSAGPSREGLGVSRSTGRSQRVPRVRQAKATVTGAMDRDIIRRIVRSHINEVRYCYKRGLDEKPALEGRVTIEFTIAANGKVSTSTVARNTMSDDEVGTCIAKAFERWKFPTPKEGDVVVVRYPFVLSPG